MQVLGKLMRHVRLVAGMAKSTKTDLVGAAQAGDLSQEYWADMVQTCRKCSWASDCPNWLAEHETVAEAPDTCLNHDRFTQLKSAASKRAKLVA
ncbi:MAG: hypothetical protein ACI8R4_003674 [Paracoccaceae bacterium]|jgi:hypothetical protein